MIIFKYPLEGKTSNIVLFLLMIDIWPI